MAKVITNFVCQNCGATSVKWLGKCPSCGEWNTYVEERTTKSPRRSAGALRVEGTAVPHPLDSLEMPAEVRLDTGIGELNRLLGGGLVAGSLVLLGGEPGIGKSTLSLQLAVSKAFQRVLYVSGEESAAQIRLRAERIHALTDRCLILNETRIEGILQQSQAVEPSLLIVDSIQTLVSEDLESTPGSVSQVRECATRLLGYAKSSGVPVLLIGHITKEGNLSGPKVLEHIVDAVLQFEGDHLHQFRVLRALKNRFGATSEIALFEMRASGLHEIQNPSEHLLSARARSTSGVAVCAVMDGTRALLVEVQALVSPSAYGTAQRQATGFDPRRMSMLLAVIEKRAGLKLIAKDVFLNIAGGLRIVDPAVDLAVIAAIVSSLLDEVIPIPYCFSGEVGLSGEVRSVPRWDMRVREAERMGFERFFGPPLPALEEKRQPKMYKPVESIEALIRYLFQNR